MRYSVIIPAFNAAATLRETIDSALQQTVTPASVLVVDDGSTDETQRIAESYGGVVSLLSQSNQGPGAAMSLGMRASDTEIIAAIDSDDVWLPRKMECQLAHLDANPDCSGVFCRAQLFGKGIVRADVRDGWTRSTMAIRRKVFQVTGDVVDPPGMRGEMIDWIARARESGFELVCLPDVLVERRVHRGSLSDQRESIRDQGYAHVARAALLRKRARLHEAANQ